MRTIRIDSSLMTLARVASVTGLILMGMTVSAQAGLDAPLQVYSGQPIVDEFGVPLLGASDDDSERRDLVQLLLADVSTDPSGVIHPPTVDGFPHPGNLPLWNGITGIGNETTPADFHPGMFSLTFGKDRPAAGTKFFVRAYNAPTFEQATFYGDSQVFTITGDTPCIATIAATDQPIDPGDDDGDGINNSMEQSLVSPTDYDRDFLTDIHEQWAGTDPTNPASVIRIEQMTPAPGGIEVQWQSVAGKSYIVQGRALDGGGYIDLSGVISADSGTTSILITPPAGGMASFRIILQSS